MNSSPKLSIIVPVYNVEKYIRECLDSIKTQTFTDFEVLLIDDGSSDSSGAICDEYAAKDTRFRVFHKENGGEGAARNVGLDNARGEWISCIDSDDSLISKTAYDEIFSHNLSDIDLIRFGYSKGENAQNTIDILPESVGLSKKEYTQQELYPLFKSFLNVTFCLFRNSLIKDLRFEPITIGTDSLFVRTYLFQVRNNTLVLNKPYYFYRDNPDSVTSVKFKENYWDVCNYWLDYMQALYDKHDYREHSDLHIDVLSSYYNGILNEYASGNKRIDLIKDFEKKYGIEKRFNLNILFRLARIRPSWLIARLKLYSLLPAADAWSRNKYLPFVNKLKK